MAVLVTDADSEVVAAESTVGEVNRWATTPRGWLANSETNGNR